MDKALRKSTHATYSSAQKRFKSFCDENNLCHLPASEDTLVLFVSQLYLDDLKGSSIRVYLSSVRSMHIFAGYPNPLGGPRLSLALKGAINESKPPVRKAPINYPLLVKLCEKSKVLPDSKLLIVAMTLGFYGCLRSGEFCLTNGEPFNESRHICLEDIEFYDTTKMFSLFLKQTKTDKANEGVRIFVGCSESKFCSYCSMKEYLSTKLGFTKHSPLLSDRFGVPMTKEFFVSSVKILLALIGEDPSLFGGHSFRCGSATAASESEFKRWEIKLMGRWKSECFNIYLRNPKVVASFAKRLANPINAI